MKLQEQILSLACNELHAATTNQEAQRAYGDGFRRAKEEASELAVPADKELVRLRAALEWIAENGPDDAWDLREKAREALVPNALVKGAQD